mmetsp:Transcript_2274/g.6403  ORF Transcript_2274/g.6403 Transcript_2274/m.6403 type:complete len:228 (+) Transcript_2274:1669-2352(+)
MWQVLQVPPNPHFVRLTRGGSNATMSCSTAFRMPLGSVLAFTAVLVTLGKNGMPHMAVFTLGINVRKHPLLSRNKFWRPAKARLPRGSEHRCLAKSRTSQWSAKQPLLLRKETLLKAIHRLVRKPRGSVSANKRSQRKPGLSLRHRIHQTTKRCLHQHLAKGLKCLPEEPQGSRKLITLPIRMKLPKTKVKEFFTPKEKSSAGRFRARRMHPSNNPLPKDSIFRIRG